MLEMIQWLYAHQAWADASILDAIAKHEAASADALLRKTLHHIVTVQRAFHSLFVRRPFDFAAEMQMPETLEEIEQLFRNAPVESIALANRALGGTPPTVDYIIWLKDRPAAWA